MSEGSVTEPHVDPLTLSLHDRARDAFRSGLDSVDAQRLVIRTISELPTPIRKALAVRRGRLYIVSAGKAALAMAAGAEDAMPQPAPLKGKKAKTIMPPPRPFGLAVTKDGAAGAALRDVEVRRAGHPIPDARSVEAADQILRTLATLNEP